MSLKRQISSEDSEDENDFDYAMKEHDDYIEKQRIHMKEMMMNPKFAEIIRSLMNDICQVKVKVTLPYTDTK
jgi:hypothetical protein